MNCVKLTAPGHTVLVSPDMLFNDDSEWKYEIQQSWEAYIERKCILAMPMERVDHRSGVKVFGEPDYTVADLRRIAAAVIYFEGPLNEYFSTFRGDGGRHDRISNRADNPTFKGKDINQILTMIEDANKPKGDPATYWNRIFPVPPGSQGYWWSYTKTSQHGGCIEMTKPAAWYGWKHAVKWVESTMCFVQAALLCPSLRQLRRYQVSEKGLGHFLKMAHGRDLEEIHRDTMDARNQRPISRDGPLKKIRGLVAPSRGGGGGRGRGGGGGGGVEGRGRRAGSGGTDLAKEAEIHLGGGAESGSRAYS